MFNYKFALSKIKSLEGSPNRLPDDFGCMYSLYPPENTNFFDFDSIGVIEKTVNFIKKTFKKTHENLDYFKTN